MADGDTLVDFVTWAMKTYPADKYVLILSDHGMGWPGGWSDADRRRRQRRPQHPAHAALDDQPLPDGTGRRARRNPPATGIDKFELIGMDACLMGQLEVFERACAPCRATPWPRRRPSRRWAGPTPASCDALTQNPDMDGARPGPAASSTATSQDDQRIVDDQARADSGRRARGLAGCSALSEPLSGPAGRGRWGRRHPDGGGPGRAADADRPA